MSIKQEEVSVDLGTIPPAALLANDGFMNALFQEMTPEQVQGFIERTTYIPRASRTSSIATPSVFDNGGEHEPVLGCFETEQPAFTSDDGAARSGGRDDDNEVGDRIHFSAKGK